jgi:hypothetical protein
MAQPVLRSRADGDEGCDAPTERTARLRQSRGVLAADGERGLPDALAFSCVIDHCCRAGRSWAKNASASATAWA